MTGAPRRLGSVCVYCASSTGHDPRFAALAADVGRCLADAGIRLVYGGGAVGLMGTVADACLDAGGEVVGIIPSGLFRREVAHQGLTRLVEVDSMHRRKQLMFQESDAFVALPGGLGTLEELAEMATWAQLGIHGHPIAVVDVAGFWRPLRSWLEGATAAGLLKQANLEIIRWVDRVEDLLPTLRAYEVAHTEKWLDLDEA